MDRYEKGPLYDQPRQNCTSGGGRAGVSGWQPEVQGEECGFGEESDSHEHSRNQRRRLGMDAARQKDDIERAIGAVQQRGAYQIENRAKKRED